MALHKELNSTQLRSVASGWEFVSEEKLENFLADNLYEIWKLEVIARQYNVKGQICDLLAVDKQQGLVIFELKNVEDRYVVQQLTRYYHALWDEQPFPTQIDYNQPIRLVAIAPNFHEHNLIDRKYSKLIIDFVSFSIVREEQDLYLELTSEDNKKVKQIITQVEQQNYPTNIPEVPKKLLNRLKQYSPQQQAKIISVREKILTFDNRLQENSTSTGFRYGNGNKKSSKFCAEFYTDSQGNLLLFLWLASKSGQGKTTKRVRIWTDWQQKALLEGYVASGIGKEITTYKKMLTKRMEKLRELASRKSGGISVKDRDLIRQYCRDMNKIVKRHHTSAIAVPEELEYVEIDMSRYFGQWIKGNPTLYDITDACYDSLNRLVDLALTKWLDRI